MTRIVAGAAKGRTIKVPASGTRPTSERVREALFSRLDHLGYVEGRAVLDLYSGSGALGLEAASRGAAFVECVESSRKAAELDLRLRSEGDVLGAAQAGRGSHLRFLSVAKDREIIETARDAAREAVAADPELAERRALADAVAAIDAGRADYLERG